MNQTDINALILKSSNDLMVKALEDKNIKKLEIAILKAIIELSKETGKLEAESVIASMALVAGSLFARYANKETLGDIFSSTCAYHMFIEIFRLRLSGQLGTLVNITSGIMFTGEPFQTQTVH